MAYLQEDLFLFLETNLYQSKLVLMQPWKRCIGASFSDWQKEKSGHEIFLNLKSFLFKYNTLFQIFYWKTRRFVSTVTRRGKRYTCFQSMSLIWKRSSKYNCDLVFELFRDICRQYSSLLLHLSKEYIWFFLIKWWSYKERASEMWLLLRSSSFQDFGIAFINWIQK